mmetsp:Transcript_28033/g.50066  ORF Transcript_28033/g.50066 Transcript_28033/m.50066 type:complete len:220 (-) Transcript_28033:127-786(-)
MRSGGRCSQTMSRGSGQGAAICMPRHTMAGPVADKAPSTARMVGVAMLVLEMVLLKVAKGSMAARTDPTPGETGSSNPLEAGIHGHRRVVRHCQRLMTRMDIIGAVRPVAATAAGERHPVVTVAGIKGARATEAKAEKVAGARQVALGVLFRHPTLPGVLLLPRAGMLTREARWSSHGQLGRQRLGPSSLSKSSRAPRPSRACRPSRVSRSSRFTSAIG